MLLQHLILATLAILATVMSAPVGKNKIPPTNAASSHLEINNIYHANRKASQEKYIRILAKIENVQFEFSDRVDVLQALVRFIRLEIHHIERRMNESQSLTREEVIEACLLKSWWLARLEGIMLLGGGGLAPAA
jgi:hypothetical protein